MKLEYRDNLAATSSTMKFSFERNGYSQKTVNKGAYKYGVTVIIEDSKGNQIFRKRYTREWNGAGLETDDAIIGDKNLYFSLNVGGVYDYQIQNLGEKVCDTYQPLYKTVGSRDASAGFNLTFTPERIGFSSDPLYTQSIYYKYYEYIGSSSAEKKVSIQIRLKRYRKS